MKSPPAEITPGTVLDFSPTLFDKSTLLLRSPVMSGDFGKSSPSQPGGMDRSVIRLGAIIANTDRPWEYRNTELFLHHIESRFRDGMEFRKINSSHQQIYNYWSICERENPIFSNAQGEEGLITWVLHQHTTYLIVGYQTYTSNLSKEQLGAICVRKMNVAHSSKGDTLVCGETEWISLLGLAGQSWLDQWCKIQDVDSTTMDLEALLQAGTPNGPMPRRVRSTPRSRIMSPESLGQVA